MQSTPNYFSKLNYINIYNKIIKIIRIEEFLKYGYFNYKLLKIAFFIFLIKVYYTGTEGEYNLMVLDLFG